MKKVALGILISLGLAILPAAARLQEPEFYKPEVFEQRRQALMQKMGTGIAVLRTTRDFPNKDFYYLTGFDEAEAACLLIPGEEKSFILFVRPDDPGRTLWTGKRHGIEGATQSFGADAAFSINQFERNLSAYLSQKTKIYCMFRDKALLDDLREMAEKSTEEFSHDLVDLTADIHAMRLIKDAEEIRLLSKAIDITSLALTEVMRAARPGMYEYELEAILEYIYHKNGSPRPGFPSIVGSGPNTTILHYETNRRQSVNGDLVLMDVGAEYGRYTADVTRTFPINGRFSPHQREIYEIVLEANKKAIGFVKPGVGLYEVHKQALEVVRAGLFRLGLITDKNSSWQTQVWLMYNTNHWIGLDVHDVGGRGPRGEVGMLLKPGMVFTVEPGIYVGDHSLAILERRLERASSQRKEEIQEFIQTVKPAMENYLHIGVRIEDDVLVTLDGHEVLSHKAVKEIDDIEALMRETSIFK